MGGTCVTGHYFQSLGCGVIMCATAAMLDQHTNNRRTHILAAARADFSPQICQHAVWVFFWLGGGGQGFIVVGCVVFVRVACSCMLLLTRGWFVAVEGVVFLVE